MSDAPQRTQFVFRGRLGGVVREHAAGGPTGGAATQPGRERGTLDELDTQAFEALYYRARLILGEPLPRPPRFQRGGPLVPVRDGNGSNRQAIDPVEIARVAGVDR